VTTGLRQQTACHKTHDVNIYGIHVNEMFDYISKPSEQGDRE
jgi:hypothetical protein